MSFLDKLPNSIEELGFICDDLPQGSPVGTSTAPENNHYRILNVIGRGSYGVVYRAANLKTGEIVAVKEEVYGLCDSTLREVEILTALPRHPSIVGFKEVVEGGGRGGGAVFVVMEYLQSDLLRYMHSNRNRFALSEVKLLMKRILEGVKFLHANGVLHGDLKPENILVDGDTGGIKICDFGLSRLFVPGATAWCTSGVGTLWYRAPELLLQGPAKVSPAIDMWAVGCIMGELVLKEPLFQGKFDFNQLLCVYHRLPSSFMDSLGEYLGDSGLDLLQRLLVYDSDMRITAEDALDHIWFKE